MKKYVLFTFDDYYPGGGMTDLRESFDTIEDAKAHKTLSDNMQIVDRDTWELVLEGSYVYIGYIRTGEIKWEDPT